MEDQEKQDWIDGQTERLIKAKERQEQRKLTYTEKNKIYAFVCDLYDEWENIYNDGENEG